MNDRVASYPDAVIRTLFEDVEKARLLSLEECEKEMEKKVRCVVSMFGNV